MLTRNIIEMYPASVSTLNDSLGTEDHTKVCALREFIKDSGDLLYRKFLCCFNSPA